jgi:hypothetical protein
LNKTFSNQKSSLKIKELRESHIRSISAHYSISWNQGHSVSALLDSEVKDQTSVDLELTCNKCHFWVIKRTLGECGLEGLLVGSQPSLRHMPTSFTSNSWLAITKNNLLRIKSSVAVFCPLEWHNNCIGNSGTRF